MSEIAQRLKNLKHATMKSDPYDADEQLNIVLFLIDCIQDIQNNDLPQTAKHEAAAWKVLGEGEG